MGLRDLNRYLLWKSDGNAVGDAVRTFSQRLDAGALHLFGPRHVLLVARESWEHGVVEGPAMIRRGLGYYLFFAGGDWRTAGYAIDFVRCQSPIGRCAEAHLKPWLYTTTRFAGPGGPSFFRTTSGVLFMAFSAWVGGVVGYPAGRRALCLTRIGFR